MRIFSFLLAIPMFFSWWYIVRSLTGSVGLAMFAVSLIALDSFVVRAMHTGRPEMLGAALAATATAVYLRFRAERLHVALGLSAGLMAASFLSHPLAILGGVLLALVILMHDLRRIRVSHVVIACATVFVIFLPWAFYIAQDPGIFAEQWAANLEGRVQRGNPLTVLASDFNNRYLGSFYTSLKGIARFRITLLVALATAMLWAALDRSFWKVRHNRLLMLAAAVAWCALAILDGTKYIQYFAHVFPFYLSATAAALYWRWSHGGTRSRIAVVALSAFIIVPNVLGSWYSGMRHRSDKEYGAVVNLIKKVRAEGEQIIAGSELGFALGFDELLVDDRALRTLPRIVVTNPYYGQIPVNPGSWQERAADLLARHYTPIYDDGGNWRVYLRTD
jgi:hypothetical protein